MQLLLKLSRAIDAMNTLFGKHAGKRANHAKGVVAEGSFTPFSPLEAVGAEEMEICLELRSRLELEVIAPRR